MPASVLANYLQAKIDRLGWNQSKLAAQAGLSKQMVSSIFNNPDHVPDLPSFVKLSEALGISLWEILEGAGYRVERPKTPDEESLRLARVLESHPWAQPIVDQLLTSDPGYRHGILAFFESLGKQGGQKG